MTLQPEPTMALPPTSSTTCPLCHTVAAVSATALAAGADWQCARCGQTWNAARVAATVDYSRFIA